jgi:hypothetical protein
MVWCYTLHDHLSPNWHRSVDSTALVPKAPFVEVAEWGLEGGPGMRRHWRPPAAPFVLIPDDAYQRQITAADHPIEGESVYALLPT